MLEATIDACTLCAALNAKAVGALQIECDEGARCGANRCPAEHEACAIEAAVGAAHKDAALLGAKRVLGASGNREVALPCREGPLGDTHTADQFGDEKERVGIAVPVCIRGLVDRHPVDQHLEVLPFACEKAAHDERARMPLAAVVEEKDARCAREMILRRATRNASKRCGFVRRIARGVGLCGTNDPRSPSRAHQRWERHR